MSLYAPTPHTGISTVWAHVLRSSHREEEKHADLYCHRKRKAANHQSFKNQYISVEERGNPNHSPILGVGGGGFEGIWGEREFCSMEKQYGLCLGLMFSQSQVGRFNFNS